ncbi:MAG: hypothetical protein QOE70_1600 [Chthoniobacter sp.]|nr:hypothetical protein [Chthoniobacter sp.]
MLKALIYLFAWTLPTIGAEVERKHSPNGYVIETWREDGRSVQHLRISQSKSKRVLFETETSDSWIGDACISDDGRFVAFASGGGSVGHNARLFKRVAGGGDEEIEFDFESACVRHLIAKGVIDNERQITHLYAQPQRFDGDVLIIRFVGDYALKGKQPQLPVTIFAFDPQAKQFEPFSRKKK